MDARIEVGALKANACLVVVHTTVEILSGVYTPVVSNLFLAPIIAIGGHSISSINPELIRIGVRAAA